MPNSVPRTRFTGFLLTALFISLAGCGGGGDSAPPTTPTPPNPPPPAAVSSVSLSTQNASLVPAQTLPLSATARDAAGNVLSGRTTTWQSSAPLVATVSADGLVTAVSPGTASVVVTVESRTATATVTVADGGYVGAAGGVIVANGGLATLRIPAGALTGPVAITVSPSTVPPSPTRLVPGTTYELGPAGTTFAVPVTLEFKYQSAALDSLQPYYRLARFTNGAWVPLASSGSGNATRTITATTTSFSSYGIVQTSFLASALVAPSFPQVLLGDAVQLTATPLDQFGAPFTGTIARRVWSGSGNASINQNGVLTGVIPGGPYLMNVLLTHWDRCDPSPCYLGSVNGQPVYADSVESKGGAQFEVFVNLKAVSTVEVAPSTAQLAVGQVQQMLVTLKEANGSVLDQQFRTITWSTTNASVANVSQSGQVTAISTGSATIRATSGGITGSATITVTGSTSNVVSVDVRPDLPTIEVGATIPLTVVARDAQGQIVDGRPVAWTLATPGVASVTAAGVLTGVSAGQAVFIATVDGVQGGGTVTVVPPYPLVLGNPSAGAQHSCLMRTNGTVWCWGNSAFGQVGTGSSSAINAQPAQVSGAGFTRVSGGEEHTCAITSGGQASCWGNGLFGRLGTGSTASSLTPSAVIGGNSFTRIAAGSGFSCALDGGGAAWCWGFAGLVGDGSRTQRTSPTAVSGGRSYSEIAAGRTSTCALSSGSTWCWGSGDNGQLGNGPKTGSPGTTWESLVPVSVIGGAFIALSSGSGINNHFCGLDAAGAAWCWGRGLSGQIGDGALTDRDAPVRVSTSVRFTAISAGGAHTCAIAVDATAWCWGARDRVGSALQGLPVNVTTPIQVFGNRAYTSISAGATHTCARAADGTWCWGTNTSGQLGNGSGQVGAGINTAPFKVRFP